VIVAGSARGPVRARATAAVPDSEPVAAVAPGDEISHLVPAGTGPSGSHVQSIAVPVPSLRPSSVPAASVIRTVQGRAADSFAVKRTPPDSSAETAGV
jgi:hypothetical protein